MNNYDDDVLNFLDELDEMNLANNRDLFELVEMVEEPPRKYTIQEKIDPFTKYDDNEFKRRYRLSKTQVWKLYDLIDGANTLEPVVSTLHSRHSETVNRSSFLCSKRLFRGVR